MCVFWRAIPAEQWLRVYKNVRLRDVSFESMTFSKSVLLPTEMYMALVLDRERKFQERNVKT